LKEIKKNNIHSKFAVSLRDVREKTTRQKPKKGDVQGRNLDPKSHTIKREVEGFIGNQNQGLDRQERSPRRTRTSQWNRGLKSKGGGRTPAHQTITEGEQNPVLIGGGKNIKIKRKRGDFKGGKRVWWVFTGGTPQKGSQADGRTKSFIHAIKKKTRGDRNKGSLTKRRCRGDLKGRKGSTTRGGGFLRRIHRRKF